MRRLFSVLCVFCSALFLCVSGFAEETTAPAKNVEKPKVQIAILLDTSSSMSGLINQARNQIWEIVNEFTKVKQSGQQPELEVALYHYGNSNLSPESNWIEQLVPFTDNLDLISEKLFSLTTSGGLEYCGMVIDEAVEELKWSKRADDLRLIFIAGNEPFTQGPVPYVDACKKAVDNFIVVNTIHCGGNQTGISEKWEDGALITDGKYFSIDHNSRTVNIPAPQDKKISELNTALNATYIPFGKEGEYGARNQLRQDTLNSAAGSSRAAAKASSFYRNSSWDLVDASQEEGFELKEIADEDLPEAMRKMTLEERQANIDSNLKKRQEIQKEISQLAQERSKFIAEETKKQAKPGEESLGTAVQKAVREQGEKKKFEFPKNE